MCHCPERDKLGPSPGSDEEAAALVALLTRTVADDRYPLSPRVRTLKDILAKLRPLPPQKVYAPPKAARWRRG
jgi:hypothetical protein